MAVIGRIRKHSVILLVVVAGALLAFIIGDISKRPRNDGYSDFIKVDNNRVSYRTFDDKFTHYQELLKQQNNGQSLTREEEYQLREQVYNEMVDSITLFMQMNALGITVTADELRDLVAAKHVCTPFLLRCQRQLQQPAGTGLFG